MLGQVRGERLEVGASPGPRDDDAAHRFPQHLVRDGEGQRAEDVRVADEHVLDLNRGDRLAAALDDVFAAPDDVQVAVGVEAADVAGVEPALGDDQVTPRGCVLLDAGQRRAAQRNAPGNARRHGLSRLVDDADVRPEDETAGPSAFEAVVDRRAGDGHAFGHAVAGQDRRREPGAEAVGRRRQQVARRVADEPKRVRRTRAAVALLEDAVVHRRRRVVPVEGGTVGQFVPEHRRIEAVGVDHRATRQQGRVQVPDDAAHVEQRHHVVAAVVGAQFQRDGDACRTHAQVTQRDRHEFLASRRSGREQLKCRVVGPVVTAAVATGGRPVAGEGRVHDEVEQADVVGVPGQADHRRAAAACGEPDVLELLTQRDDHRLRVGLGKIRGDLTLGVPRVHRHHGAAHAHGHQADRQLRTVRNRDRTVVTRSQVQLAERDAVAQELVQPLVRQ